MTTVCLTILMKRISVLFLFSFQSNLGVLYMLKYECSNDRKYVKKNIFFIILNFNSLIFTFYFFLFNCIAWL